MIQYAKDPLDPVRAGKLKAWLGSDEAQLFKDCITARMHEHFLNASNIRSKPAEIEADIDKLELQASMQDEEARKHSVFLQSFEFFSDPEHGFYKLKIIN